MASRATRSSSALQPPVQEERAADSQTRGYRGSQDGAAPRTALGDISNRAADPKVRAACKRSAVQGGRRWQPTVGPAPVPARAYVVTRRPLWVAFKRDVQPPAPNPSPEPPPEPQTECSQPKLQFPTLLEESRCAPTAEMLCQAFSHVILEPGDLDVEDGDDANLCSSHVKDIYKYLRHLEENKPVKCKYLAGKEIDGNVHAVVIDWLAKVHEKFELQEETLFMTVATTDHFFQVDSKQYVLAKYLMELCAVDYDMDHLSPSGIAAAVFCLPLKLLNGCELLPSLQHYMFYTESDLLPIVQYMAKNVVLVNQDAATRRMSARLDLDSSKELCKVDDLFSLVAELKKEGERMGSIGDSEEEVSW